MSPDEMIEEHDRNVRLVAEAVFGLVAKFQPQGMTPVAVFEGAIRGGALAMALGNGETPQNIAESLEEIAAGFAVMSAAAFATVSH